LELCNSWDQNPLGTFPWKLFGRLVFKPWKGDFLFLTERNGVTLLGKGLGFLFSLFAKKGGLFHKGGKGLTRRSF